MRDPFPHQTLSESEAQAHAAKVDQWLGLRTQQTEAELLRHGCRLRPRHASGEKQELWLGLDVQRLLTPYVEIRCVLEHLQPVPGQTVVDLGAGYGRMAFVMARHFPRVQFMGYEYVGERVQEFRRCARQHHLREDVLEQADLSCTEFLPTAADFYFVYDFGSAKAIEKVLHDLRRLAIQRHFVLVARGRHCRAAIEARHLWLRSDIRLTPQMTVYQPVAWRPELSPAAA